MDLLGLLSQTVVNTVFEHSGPQLPSPIVPLHKGSNNVIGWASDCGEPDNPSSRGRTPPHWPVTRRTLDKAAQLTRAKQLGMMQWTQRLHVYRRLCTLGPGEKEVQCCLKQPSLQRLAIITRQRKPTLLMHKNQH